MNERLVKVDRGKIAYGRELIVNMAHFDGLILDYASLMFTALLSSRKIVNGCTLGITY